MIVSLGSLDGSGRDDHVYEVLIEAVARVNALCCGNFGRMELACRFGSFRYANPEDGSEAPLEDIAALAASGLVSCMSAAAWELRDRWDAGDRSARAYVFEFGRVGHVVRRHAVVRLGDGSLFDPCKAWLGASDVS